MVVAEGGAILQLDMLCQKHRYTLMEQSFNSRITCMQYNLKIFMRIIDNDQKNNGKISGKIISKILSIIGTGLMSDFCKSGHIAIIHEV